MKRLVLLVFLFLLALSCAFASVGFGYSVAPVGQREIDIDDSFCAISLAGLFSIDIDHHYLDMELDVLLSPVHPFFNGINLLFSCNPFELKNHPFKFIFSNPVLWSPKITAGVQYRLGSEYNLVLGLSPLLFLDPKYMYEFFSPYAIYNWEENKWGYGIYIMKFSFFWGMK